MLDSAHLLQYLMKLGELSPVIFPTYLLLIYRAALSHEYWKAIRCLPYVAPAADGDPYRMSKFEFWTSRIFALTLLIYLWFAIFLPWFLEDAGQIRLANLIMLPIPLAMIIFTAFTKSFTGMRIGIARGDDEGPVEYEEPANPRMKRAATVLTGIFCLCAGFSAAWSWHGQPYFIAVVLYAALSLRFFPDMRDSKKFMMECLLTAAIVASLLAFLAFHCIKSRSSEPYPFEFFKPLPDKLLSWGDLSFSVLYISALFTFLSMLYRFDSRSETQGQGLPAPTNGRATFIWIKAIPIRKVMVRMQSKPYFARAMQVLLIVLFLVPTLDVAGLVTLNVCNFLALVAVIAYPLIALSAVVLARYRGEWKHFICYKEDWRKIPEVKNKESGTDEKEKQLPLTVIRN